MAKTATAPVRVAIVGSGPAGFYAAADLLRDSDREIEVDMFDRLPTPWGLVRAGVAPDHPKIKAVSRVYEKTAANPAFRFFGCVELGHHVSRDDLLRRYHAVVYAVGAQTDRSMGIPGEDLAGSWAATELVGWYNAHPDYRDLEFDLSAERAVVVGNGNVAADVARMLALTREELAVTDVADHALDALAENGIREILVVGRRGPLQVAFTNPELRELGEMAAADIVVAPEEVELDPLSRKQLEEGAPDPTHVRNLELLQDYSRRRSEGKPKRIVLRFLLSPVEIVGDGRVEGIVLGHNELYRDGDGQIRARETTRHEEVACGLVFRSIGYRGVPLEGVPFDEWKGTIPNDRGRVLDPRAQRRLDHEYVVGWIKRGPTGVIGTNKRDAQETVDLLLEDLAEGRLSDPEEPDRDSIEALLAERAPDHVTYAGWEAIDRRERAAGEPHGRPRVKLASWDELREAAAAEDVLAE